MKFRAIVILVCAGIVAGCASSTRPCDIPQPVAVVQPVAAVAATQVSSRPIDRAIADGVRFLQQSQNADGSWGTGTETRGTEVIASVPGSHDGFRVATTALAVMALKHAGETSAHAKGLNYLVNHGEVRRATPVLIYNVWAHTYAVQCLAMEMRDNTDPKIRQACLWHIDRLKRYQTYIGGWNYYDFMAQTQEPSMGPTSFGTGAGLVALWEAKRSGLDSPAEFISRSVRRLEEMRLPDGAYLYGHHLQYRPRHPANTWRGSIGRSQAGNLGLMVWDSKVIDVAGVRYGLEMLFKEHPYLEMGRKRPYPHESWYMTAAYYYYFGHYYASRLLQYLPPADQAEFARQLIDVILPHQEPDGSWWDYAMWDYHKPYGTAFALMTLLNCQKSRSQDTHSGKAKPILSP